MARETKVGLVAGLAFIVCFAIILTNKGTRDPLPPASRLADASGRNVRVRNARPTSTPSSRNRTRRPSPTGSAAPTVHLGPSTPADRSTARPADPEWRRPVPVTEYELGRETTPQTEPATSAEPIRAPSTSLSSHPTLADQTEPRTIPYPGAASDQPAYRADRPSADQPEQIQPRHAEPVTRPTRDAASRDRVETVSAPRRAVLAQHTVAAGDTLTGIAAKYYGKSSRRFINAIVDANRSTIADPDKLRTGLDLVIPSIDSPPGEPVRRAVADAARTTARPAHRLGRPGQYRWYQIRKNDRYISIAREQLGDASRWQEIYELNKDKFPDAGMIREGVRIKLPMDQSVSAAEGGH